MRWVTIVSSILSAVLVASVALPSSAAAQGGACRADMQKFCKGLRPHSEEGLRCLQQHLAELSEACRRRVERRASRPGRGVHAICQADIDKFCKDVPPGPGRVRDCLVAHEAELSAECKAALAQRGRRRRKGRATPAP